MRGSPLYFFWKVLILSLYFPIGMAIMPIILFAAMGSVSYVVGGCLSLDSCWSNVVVDYFSSEKTWKLLLLSWGSSLVIFLAYFYRALKPEVHEWFRRSKFK